MQRCRRAGQFEEHIPNRMTYIAAEEEDGAVSLLLHVRSSHCPDEVQKQIAITGKYFLQPASKNGR